MDEIEALIFESVKDRFKDLGIGYEEEKLKAEVKWFFFFDSMEVIYNEIFNKAEEFVKEYRTGSVLEIKRTEN